MLSTTQNPRLLFQTNGEFSHTGDLIDTTLFTYTLPANTMLNQSSLKFALQWTNTALAAATNTIFFGASSIGISASGLPSNRSEQFMIHNQNNQNIQRFWNLNYSLATNSQIVPMASVVENTEQDLDITFNVQLANAADTFILIHFSIILQQ